MRPVRQVSKRESEGKELEIYLDEWETVQEMKIPPLLIAKTLNQNPPPPSQWGDISHYLGDQVDVGKTEAIHVDTGGSGGFGPLVPV